jgi:hypothetical protein
LTRVADMRISLLFKKQSPKAPPFAGIVSAAL